MNTRTITLGSTEWPTLIAELDTRIAQQRAWISAKHSTDEERAEAGRRVDILMDVQAQIGAQT